TNQIWQGGSLPSVGEATYLPIAEEIKEQTGAPGDETPQGDPWQFRLPADLVKLGKRDDPLPTCHWSGGVIAKSGNWDWVPDQVRCLESSVDGVTKAAIVGATEP